MTINQSEIQSYLEKKFPGAELKEFKELGKGVYGTAYLIEFIVGSETKRLVLKTMNKNQIGGHDFNSDIAANFVLAHETFGNLPKHIKSYDLVAKGSDLVSIGDTEEYYILLEEAKGTAYNEILLELYQRGVTDADREKVKALALYLAEIHANKKDAPELYIRRARDLVGHGEYTMGMMDAHPKDSELTQEIKIELGKACIDWWQKLQAHTKRLCVIHGDFHPFNILFKGNDFTLLDRSRGEFGEPADDLSALAINFLWWSIIKYGKLDQEFQELWELLFETYRDKTKDTEILNLIQPFFAFRALVVANPMFYNDEWYKGQGCEDPSGVRTKMITFARRVINADNVDFKNINEFLE